MLGATVISPLEIKVCQGEWMKVSPADYVSLLTSRELVERLEGLPANLVGLRDCATGAVYFVDFGDLVRFQAADLGHMESQDC